MALPETERKENFEVAQLWVRVDLQVELPKKIISGFSNGREVDISVAYPWLPGKCVHCNKFGHDSNKCSTKPLASGRPIKTSRRSKSRDRSAKRSSRQGRVMTYVRKSSPASNSKESALNADSFCLMLSRQKAKNYLKTLLKLPLMLIFQKLRRRIRRMDLAYQIYLLRQKLEMRLFRLFLQQWRPIYQLPMLKQSHPPLIVTLQECQALR